MCDDHAPEAAPAPSRRRVLQGMVALAAFAGMGTGRTALAARLPARPPNAAGLNGYALAMHLHASASEGVGSVRSQLAQAATNGFDVAWFTEHDWRRHRLLFRPAYHFLANDVAQGGRWTLAKLSNVGSLTTTSGGVLVTSPVSRNDPASSKGSLRLRATSTGTAQGTVRYRVNAQGASRANFRARIAGRTVSIDVLPTRSGANSWAQVQFRLSHHPGTTGRPAGVLTLLYRLRTDLTSRVVSRQGTQGIIDVPVTLNAWQSVTFDLTADVARVWSDLRPEDNSLNEIEFHAASRNRSFTEAFFSYLRFDELAGYDAIGAEHALVSAYAGAVPSVLGLVGTEISLGPHINQYGGRQNPYPYANATSLDSDLGEIRSSIVDFIHQQGGLASINHPFKPGDTGQLGTAEEVARTLLSVGPGADILEVGYANKHGGDLGEHLAVWDTLSRNGHFLTANGVSDDHSGQNWAGQTNRFYTVAWAPEKSEGALKNALAAGQGYVGFLGGFAGTIDMDIDGTVSMGAVSVNSPASRTLRVDVTGVPTGGAVQVVRGYVDYAGSRYAHPNTSVIRTVGSGVTTLGVDIGADCFHRVQVVNSSGAVVAFGQPIWTFTGAPRTAVPAARQTAG